MNALYCTLYTLYPLLLEGDSWIEKVLNGIGEAISTALSAVWGSISKVLWDGFVEFLVKAINEFAGFLIDKISTVNEQLFTQPTVQGLLRFFLQLGWALLIAGMVLAVFDICVEYQSMGCINIKRQILPFLTGLIAVNLFTALPVALYQFAVDQQGLLMNMLLTLSGSGSAWVDIQSNAITVCAGFALGPAGSFVLGGAIYGIALTIIYIYCIVKVFFANLKRGGVLLTMMGVGSLYMISIPRGYTDGWWSWCKQVVGLCVTTVLQNVLLYLGCITASDSGTILLGVGIMLAANEVPRIAGQFGLDTSAKANIASAAYAAQAAMHIARAGSHISHAASSAAGTAGGAA